MINPLYQKTYSLLQVAFFFMALPWAIHGNAKLVIVNLATVVFVWWAARVDRKLESLL
jgi:hypothetical protein